MKKRNTCNSHNKLKKQPFQNYYNIDLSLLFKVLYHVISIIIIVSISTRPHQVREYHNINSSYYIYIPFVILNIILLSLISRKIIMFVFLIKEVTTKTYDQ